MLPSTGYEKILPKLGALTLVGVRIVSCRFWPSRLLLYCQVSTLMIAAGGCTAKAKTPTPITPRNSKNARRFIVRTPLTNFLISANRCAEIVFPIPLSISLICGACYGHALWTTAACIEQAHIGVQCALQLRSERHADGAGGVSSQALRTVVGF